MKKHNHAEAFMHMTYVSSDPKKQIKVVIWNSRDGVTPFCFHSQEFGVQLQHSAWQRDVYDPTYKPKAGDLIWRSATEEDYKKWYEQRKESLRSITDPQGIKMAQEFLKHIEDDPEYFFSEFSGGEPVLQLVEHAKHS